MSVREDIDSGKRNLKYIPTIFIENKKLGKRRIKTLAIESRITPPISLDISDMKALGDVIELTLYEYWVRGK